MARKRLPRRPDRLCGDEAKPETRRKLERAPRDRPGPEPAEPGAGSGDADAAERLRALLEQDPD